MGEIKMDPKITYSLNEISLTTGIGEETILTYIEEEWIVPFSVDGPDRCIFDEEDLGRLLLIKELMVRMEVNPESIPIILHLIDQIHGLHLVIEEK